MIHTNGDYYQHSGAKLKTGFLLNFASILLSEWNIENPPKYESLNPSNKRYHCQFQEIMALDVKVESYPLWIYDLYDRAYFSIS